MRQKCKHLGFLSFITETIKGKQILQVIADILNLGSKFFKRWLCKDDVV